MGMEAFWNILHSLGLTKYYVLNPATPLSITCAPYVVRKSREQGEKELVKLSREEQVVGIWKYSPHNSLWFHTSQEARTIEIEGKIISFEAVDSEDDALYKQDVIEYYTQPKKIGESLNVKPSDLEIIASTYLCFPTPWVIDHLAYSMQKYPNVHVFGAVASPSGITKIALIEPDVRADYAKFFGQLLKTCNEVTKYTDIPQEKRIKALFEVLNNFFQHRIVLWFA